MERNERGSVALWQTGTQHRTLYLYLYLYSVLCTLCLYLSAMYLYLARGCGAVGLCV